MPIVMVMKWKGVTPKQYDDARRVVEWETKKPKGGLYHVAAFDKDGLRVTDVWESAEDFDNFVKNRLMPGVKQLGVQGEPQVEIFPTHAIFAPGYKTL